MLRVCFMSLRILLKQFYNKHISKEQATNLKNKIYKKYNDNKKQYEFEENMFKEHISNIAKTSDLRILLRHQLNEQSEYKIEPKKIRFVYSKKEDNSNLVLIKAVKNAGEFLKIEKPLYIYDENNKYTDEVLGIYNKK